MLLPTEILIKKLALITTVRAACACVCARERARARVQRDGAASRRVATAGMQERKRPGEKLDECILINASSVLSRFCVARISGRPKDKRILVIALLPRIYANSTRISVSLFVSYSRL